MGLAKKRRCEVRMQLENPHRFLSIYCDISTSTRMLQYSKDEACQIVKPSGDFKVYLLKAKKLRWKVRLQVENPHDVVSVFIAIYL